MEVIDRSRASRGGARRMGLAVSACLVLAGAASGVVAAATPALSAPAGLASVQAWLDADFITPDAPPGGHLTAGVTLWDTAAHAFATIDGLTAVLRPRTGHATPGAGTITVDFPGHVTIDLVVPKGGPGALALVVRTDAGEAPLPIAGTGPPPEAPLEQLLTVTYHRFVGTLVAGRPFPVTAEVVGRGQWDISSLSIPPEVTVTATQKGQGVATGLLDNTGGPGLPFTGHLTIPATGDVTLTIGLKQPDGTVTPIPGSDTTVTVTEGGRPSPSSAPIVATPTPNGDSGPAIWIAIAVVLLVALALVAGPAFRRRRAGA